VRLFAAAVSLLRELGAWLSSVEGDPITTAFRQALEKARAQIGPEAFEAAWAEGQQMTLEQALALATEIESEESQPSKT
jgi:hypothetical protein